VALTVALATTLLTLPLWTSPWNLFDGGIAAASAGFTVQGLLPYRDYWLLYGPLSGWLLAIPTALLGPSVELTRLVGLILLAGQAAIVYQLCRRWTFAFPAALLAIVSSLLVAAFYGLETSAWTVSMTFALLALSLRLDARRTFLVGLIIGLASLARLDVGAYALLAALLLPDRRRLLAGFTVVALPIWLLLALLTPLSSMIEQLLWYPLVGRRQFRGVPGLDTMMPLAVAIGLSVMLAVIPRLAIAIAVIRGLADHRRDLLAIAVFAALCQLQTDGRVDAAHLAIATTPSLVLIAANLPRGRRASLFGTGIIAPPLFAAAIAGGMIAVSAPNVRDLSLRQSIDIVRAATDENDAIHVGLASHRHTPLNAILAYYLADRPPGSRWTMYNPGLTNTDAPQGSIAADLESTGTNYLILDVDSAGQFEYTNESRIPGSTILDAYISARFRTLCDFGAFIVAVRMERDPHGPCPVPDG